MQQRQIQPNVGGTYFGIGRPIRETYAAFYQLTKHGNGVDTELSGYPTGRKLTENAQLDLRYRGLTLRPFDDPAENDSGYFDLQTGRRPRPEIPRRNVDVSLAPWGQVLSWARPQGVDLIGGLWSAPARRSFFCDSVDGDLALHQRDTLDDV